MSERANRTDVVRRGHDRLDRQLKQRRTVPVKHALFAQLERAYNKKDAKAAAGLFVGDGDFTNPFGTHGKGRAAIEKVFAQDFPIFQVSTLTVSDWRSIGGGVALVDALHVTRDARGKLVCEALMTAVLAQKGGRWRFLALRVNFGPI